LESKLCCCGIVAKACDKEAGAGSRLLSCVELVWASEATLKKKARPKCRASPNAFRSPEKSARESPSQKNGEAWQKWGDNRPRGKNAKRCNRNIVGAYNAFAMGSLPITGSPHTEPEEAPTPPPWPGASSRSPAAQRHKKSPGLTDRG